jgi:hypothetical protein
MSKLRDLWSQFGGIDHPVIFVLTGDAQTKEEIAQKSGFAKATVSRVIYQHQPTGLLSRQPDRLNNNRVSWALGGDLAYYNSIENAVVNTLKYEKKYIAFGYPVRDGRYMRPPALVAHEVVAFLGITEQSFGSLGPHVSVLTLCGNVQQRNAQQLRRLRCVRICP